MKDNDRIVYRDEDGNWRDKRLGADRPAGSFDTQREAEDAARQHLRNTGGGELITKGLDGKIRSKDTIAPGNDPYPPKDREH
jgi:hypothetical protein